MNISPKLFYRQYFKDLISESSLTELFKDTYPYRLDRSIGSIRRTFYFSTEDSVEYEVVIDKTSLEHLPDELVSVIKNSGYKDYKEEDYDYNWENEYVMDVVFGNLYGPIKIRNYNTNTVKNPSKVLGTVIKIIRENVRNDEIIYFSSKENNRTKLYSHIAKNLKRPHDGIHQEKYSGESLFLLIPEG